MFFRIKYQIKAIDLGSRETLEWESSSFPYKVTFELRALLENETKPGFKKSDRMCIITAEYTSPKNEEEIFGSITNKIPPELKVFIDQMFDFLYEFVLRTVNGYSWMRGETVYRPIRYFRAYQFSFDGEQWKSFPEQISFGPPLISTLMSNTVTDAFVEQVIEFVKQKKNVPLSHDLFSEAWFQVSDMPRSSLVLAIAAAETGVKECIGSLLLKKDLPEWFIKQKQAPPLIRLLSSVIPILPAKETVRGKVLPPPTLLIKSIAKGVALRNGIVHGQSKSFTAEELHEVLYAVRDVLYLLYYYCGHKWAADYIGHTTREALLADATK